MTVVRLADRREPWPFLTIGQMVRVAAGPLKGLEGRLAQVRDGWRVVISIELLHRSVAVLVEREVIEPLEPFESRFGATSGLSSCRTPAPVLEEGLYGMP